jgi:hypothetical protein
MSSILSYKHWIGKCIKYNLEKIKKEDGYNVDVQKIDTSHQEIHVIQTPSIKLEITSLKRVYQTGSSMEFFFTYHLVPVIELENAQGAVDITEAMNMFEKDIVDCHHADFFLQTAFSSMPDEEMPEEMRTFYLRDHKLGDANYVFTTRRAYMLLEATAEYELVGQQSI